MAENKEAKKTISLPEFQSWLQGIYDLQGDDWSPNPDQWKKIKDKMASVEGYDIPLEKQITMMVERALSRIRWQNFAPPVQQQNYDWTQKSDPNVAPGAPASNGQPPVNMPPAGNQQPQGSPPVALPGGSTLTNANSATPPLTLPAGARVGNLDPSQAIKIEAAKTPDIDTSTGSYKSNQFL